MWLMVLGMVGFMTLVMTGGMLVLHRKANEITNGKPRGMQSALSLLINRVVTRLLRAGVPVKILGNPVVLLTVPGRATGQPRTTLVDLFERDGRRFLVSTHGSDKAQWVRNLRAAGKGTLTHGRRLHEVMAVELPPEAAGMLLKEILGLRLASPLGGFALRQTLEVTADASLDDFINVARSHPVFELSS